MNIGMMLVMSAIGTKVHAKLGRKQITLYALGAAANIYGIVKCLKEHS